MREIFVSRDGHDDSSGSYGSPVRSLLRANSMIGPGDKLLLRAGDTWDDASGVVLPERARLGTYGNGLPARLGGMETAVVLDGDGANVANVEVIDTRGPGVRIDADDCLVEYLVVRHCGRNGSAKDRGITAYHVSSPTIKHTLVHDTHGGDNIFIFDCPTPTVTDCDLARPGPESGDNLHFNGTKDFYVARTKFSDVTSGKGHFISHPWTFLTTGGVCEHCEFYGAANFGVCLVQPRSVYRFNKMFGQKEKTAKWAAALWCANDESHSPISGIEIHGNLIVGYRNGFGSWLPNIDYPVQIDFDDNTFVGCDRWFNYEGKAELSGDFSNGIVIAENGRLERLPKINFSRTFMVH